MYNPTAAFEEQNLPTDPGRVFPLSIDRYLLPDILAGQQQDKFHTPSSEITKYKIIIDKLDRKLWQGVLEAAIVLKSAPANNPLD